MSVTHTHTLNWASGASSIAKSIAVSSGLETNLDETIPAESTDKVVGWTMDVSQLKAFYMVTDAAMTVKTNTGANDTFTMVAGQPLTWYFGCGLTNPLTVDVTQLQVTSVAGGLLSIRALSDPTI